MYLLILYFEEHSQVKSITSNLTFSFHFTIISPRLHVVVYTFVLLSLTEIQDELQSADARCKLLEKQLEYMRKMVQTAETERDSAIQRSTMLAQQTVQQTTEEIKTQLDKLSGLERDHMKLTASHSIAEVLINKGFKCVKNNGLL